MAVLPCVAEDMRSDFLHRVTSAIAQEYEEFWKISRYDQEMGLFHYGNSAQGILGPCPEVTFGERDEKGLSHYDKVSLYLRDLAPTDVLRQRFYDETSCGLTLEGIAGDRAMRESGFDTSMHMGYYGLETIDYHPVCLNSLLSMQCQMLAHMYHELKQPDRAAAAAHEARTLQTNIRNYLWNDDLKLFCNFNRRTCKPSVFPYLTCVYPLWASIATPDQARHFRDHLALFETAFGIRGTDQKTGCQWDAPFMWAPLVYFTVAGLQRYGFVDDAQRIGRKFIDTVGRVNEAANADFEKYNAETGGIRTEGIIEVGYSENVTGFGWTNGTVSIIRNWLEKDGHIDQLEIWPSFVAFTADTSSKFSVFTR
jgi:alpha,alpha-trehalase